MTGFLLIFEQYLLLKQLYEIGPNLTLVSLSKTLNHYCFVLQMGHKAIGPMCCAMQYTLIAERMFLTVDELIDPMSYFVVV